MVVVVVVVAAVEGVGDVVEGAAVGSTEAEAEGGAGEGEAVAVAVAGGPSVAGSIEGSAVPSLELVFMLADELRLRDEAAAEDGCSSCSNGSADPGMELGIELGIELGMEPR